MRPESLNRDSSKEFLSTVAVLGAVVFLSQFAFTQKVRNKIWKRDGGKSVLSGRTENLEAAHISHDKSKQGYNDPSNGRLLTTAEHMWDHINRHGRNDLSETGNDWAIMMLWRRFWGIK